MIARQRKEREESLLNILGYVKSTLFQQNMEFKKSLTTSSPVKFVKLRDHACETISQKPQQTNTNALSSQKQTSTPMNIPQSSSQIITAYQQLSASELSSPRLRTQKRMRLLSSFKQPRNTQQQSHIITQLNKQKKVKSCYFEPYQPAPQNQVLSQQYQQSLTDSLKKADQQISSQICLNSNSDSRNRTKLNVSCNNHSKQQQLRQLDISSNLYDHNIFKSLHVSPSMNSINTTKSHSNMKHQLSLKSFYLQPDSSQQPPLPSTIINLNKARFQVSSTPELVISPRIASCTTSSTTTTETPKPESQQGFNSNISCHSLSTIVSFQKESLKQSLPTLTQLQTGSVAGNTISTQITLNRSSTFSQLSTPSKLFQYTKTLNRWKLNSQVSQNNSRIHSNEQSFQSPTITKDNIAMNTPNTTEITATTTSVTSHSPQTQKPKRSLQTQQSSHRFLWADQLSSNIIGIPESLVGQKQAYLCQSTAIAGGTLPTTEIRFDSIERLPSKRIENSSMNQLLKSKESKLKQQGSFDGLGNYQNAAFKQQLQLQDSSQSKLKRQFSKKLLRSTSTAISNSTCSLSSFSPVVRSNKSKFTFPSMNGIYENKNSNNEKSSSPCLSTSSQMFTNSPKLAASLNEYQQQQQQCFSTADHIELVIANDRNSMSSFGRVKALSRFCLQPNDESENDYCDDYDQMTLNVGRSTTLNCLNTAVSTQKSDGFFKRRFNISQVHDDNYSMMRETLLGNLKRNNEMTQYILNQGYSLDMFTFYMMKIYMNCSEQIVSALSNQKEIALLPLTHSHTDIILSSDKNINLLLQIPSQTIKSNDNDDSPILLSNTSIHLQEPLIELLEEVEQQQQQQQYQQSNELENKQNPISSLKNIDIPRALTQVNQQYQLRIIDILEKKQGLDSTKLRISSTNQLELSHKFPILRVNQATMDYVRDVFCEKMKELSISRSLISAFYDHFNVTIKQVLPSSFLKILGGESAVREVTEELLNYLHSDKGMLQAYDERFIGVVARGILHLLQNDQNALNVILREFIAVSGSLPVSDAEFYQIKIGIRKVMLEKGYEEEYVFGVQALVQKQRGSFFQRDDFSKDAAFKNGFLTAIAKKKKIVNSFIEWNYLGNLEFYDMLFGCLFEEIPYMDFVSYLEVKLKVNDVVECSLQVFLDELIECIFECADSFVYCENPMHDVLRKKDVLIKMERIKQKAGLVSLLDGIEKFKHSSSIAEFTQKIMAYSEDVLVNQSQEGSIRFPEAFNEIELLNAKFVQEYLEFIVSPQEQVFSIYDLEYARDFHNINQFDFCFNVWLEGIKVNIIDELDSQSFTQEEKSSIFSFFLLNSFHLEQLQSSSN